MRKAAEGAGKVLWYEHFRPKLYGATALKAQLLRESKQKKPPRLIYHGPSHYLSPDHFQEIDTLN